MLARWLPILEWLPRYRREDLPGDLVAGLTGAANIRLALTGVDEDVRAVMDRSGLSELLGADAFFATDADAVSVIEAPPNPSM